LDFGLRILDLLDAGIRSEIRNPKSKMTYPCRCLCFVFVQITRTTPLRRTILQFSQIRLTLLRTFMTRSLSRSLGRYSYSDYLTSRGRRLPQG